MAYAEDFEKALQVGRPPHVQTLCPNSKALIVSGKAVDRAMRAKGKAIAMAANGRNSFVIRGALRAAQRANAALIIEIAKSEGGQKAYCAVNYWNMARVVDALCNEMGITIPVAMTTTAFVDCVSPIDGDGLQLAPGQDIKGRLWDVLWMFTSAVRSGGRDESEILFRLRVVPNIPVGSKRQPRAKLVTLKAVIGGDDRGDPCITIMYPHED